MKKEPEFIFEDNGITNTLMFIILSILTIGLCCLFYDEFIESKYFRNKKRLLKALKSNDLKITEKRILDLYSNSNIIEYELNNKYTLWYYVDRNKITFDLGINHNYQHNLIGLFESSIMSRKLTKRIIKEILIKDIK